jgi:hypothetical protein
MTKKLLILVILLLGSKPSPSVADLNPDNITYPGREVVICSGSKTYALHADRTVLHEWDIKNPIVSSSGGTSPSTPQVCSLHQNITAVSQVVQTGAAEDYLSAASIADIRLDGQRFLDVMVSSGYNLYTFNTQKSSPEHRQPWPEYLHDPMHTSFYSGPLSGDANGSGAVTVSDVIYIINFLFKGGPYPVDGDGNESLVSGDANCDQKITVSDVVYLINFLFKGGCPPCQTCGQGKVTTFFSNTASIGFSSATKLSDGNQRVYINGTLSVPV